MNIKFLAFSMQVIFLASATAMACESKNSELGYHLKNSSFVTFITDSVGDCYVMCLVDQRCSSINYDLRTRVCDHNYLAKAGFSWMFERKDSSIYAETLKNPDYGSSAHVPAPSCKFIKERKPQSPSGTYWIQLPGIQSFQVYCDMTTDGGGWTFVYHYHFTNFTFFTNLGNAVTPIPSWTVDEVPSKLSPVSKNAPLNDWSFAAMDFPLWKKFGNEILVKSTITHWIACTSGTGDLLNWKPGSINCRLIKFVADLCLGHMYVPTKLQIISYCGPALRTDNNRSFVFFDGSIKSCYPTHDPCGTSQVTNHRTDAEVPKGSLYVR